MAETRQIKTADGSIISFINIDGKNLMHSWDGPAYIPQGNKRAAEYWVYSFKFTKDQWEESKKDWNGVPFHKTAAAKAAGVRT